MGHKIFKIILSVFLVIAVCATLIDFSRAARLSGDEEVTPAASESIDSPASSPDVTDSAVDNNSASLDNNSGANSSSLSEKAVNSHSNSPEASDTVAIDIENGDITQFIKLISELTNKNFIVDSSVKGKVTIISPKEITVEEAYKVFESVLEVYGFTTVPAGSVIKIVPAIDARSKDIDTLLKDEAISPEDKVVTQLIPLKYADPEEIKKAFSPFISKSSVMVSYPPTGMLIVTDMLSNITRLLEIIEAIDVAGTGSEISVIPLEHATADVMASSLNTVFKATSQDAKTAESTGSITIVDDERTNSLIVLASAVDTLKVRQLIGLLDKETPRGEGNIHVYYLQNANAEDLAKVLTEIPTGETSSAGSQDPAKETAVVLSRDVQIIADKATNSLIINANKDDYLILENVIQKLDITRRMVYIEALIMEVNMSKQFELGVQWYGGKITGSFDGNDVVSFGSSNPGSNNLPSITTEGFSFPTGLSLGVLGDAITIGDLTFPSIGAVVRAYGTNSDVHILSTPQIMTLDNEEAEIKVADNIPFLSRKDTSTTGVDYSNYDFKDVGVTLNITPQINQERFVRLKISQKVDQVVEQEEIGLPTTLTREATTTISIKDGQTVVIGGLIDETKNNTNYKVPILGDIPVLGHLFRSRTETLDKKNLYIFITPHIVENPAESTEIFETKKGHIDTIQEGAIRLYEGRGVSEDMRLSDLGYGYLETGDYDRALEYYEKALEINPDNPYALLNTGFIYEKLDEKDRATAMYERLIELDPDERAATTTDHLQYGRKLSDIAKDNLENLQKENETNR